MLAFDVSAFRAQFPAYANTTTYPNNTLSMYWDTATFYISSNDYGWLNGDKRQRALNMMTAHLVCLSDKIAAGETPGLEQAATIDKVSITLTPPPVKSQFMWWLSLTPYGAQLLALLSTMGAGGMYIGGNRETSAFRKAFGVF